MRVLHIHRIAGVGGSERHLLTLLPALARAGVEPVLLGLDDLAGDPESFYASLQGVDTSRVTSTGRIEPGLARHVVGLARKVSPDLVHTHLVHGDVYGCIAAWRNGLPLVSTKHNDDPFRQGPFRFVERVLAARAKQIIVITEALARFNVERVGLPAEKLRVVHYGLDALPPAWGPNPALDLAPDRAVILAVSRLVPQKGLDVAVRALPAILLAEPRAVLVVLGDGPERSALQSLAERLGVADAVRLPGRAGDVAGWLRRADVLVHPARWEGFGLVLLEAMLASLPVVAARVSSIPEIVIDGETGLIVPPDDAAALAAAVGRVLADEALAAALGRAGESRARTKFSVEHMVRRTVAVYDEAAATTASAQESTE